MINGVRLKVCGITSLVDADLADACGADYLGFILYPKSPRFLTVDAFEGMLPLLPPRRKVAVSVNPTVDALREQIAAGFDFFQVHFPHDAPLSEVSAWSAAVGKERLWLAPKLPPQAPFTDSWLEQAGTVLWDTFDAAGFGGSGRTGDWARFRQLQEIHKSSAWILAGGLNAENVRDAVTGAGAKWVDVNSGVEASPGVKDVTKLKTFVTRLHEATKSANPSYR